MDQRTEREILAAHADRLNAGLSGVAAYPSMTREQQRVLRHVTNAPMPRRYVYRRSRRVQGPAANHDLAPYERVVNFAVLDRDFDIERGELTPKGSFRRKAIAEHFAEPIEQLYRQDFVELVSKGYRVRIPRWFYRDLGILETAIVEHPALA